MFIQIPRGFYFASALDELGENRMSVIAYQTGDEVKPSGSPLAFFASQKF